MATILAVDDSISMRTLVARTLSDGGHTVVEAADGKQALELASRRAFSLVISDVNMPVMDGLSFVREFRKLETGRFVPVLFLTTEIDAEKKAEAKKAGATGWIVKPFSPEVLLATIKKVL
jgi:two-component system, chemotaxis family, chemotaxis protein CheY